VTPASEDAAIRSAYRTLMRHYHPDADSRAELPNARGRSMKPIASSVIGNEGRNTTSSSRSRAR
jgi:curved DNA-binding protein CbpA